MTKEEILDKCHQDFIKEVGLSSIHTPNFPAAYKEQALRAMEQYASQQGGMRKEFEKLIVDRLDDARKVYVGLEPKDETRIRMHVKIRTYEECINVLEEKWPLYLSESPQKEEGEQDEEKAWEELIEAIGGMVGCDLNQRPYATSVLKQHFRVVKK